MNEEEKQSKLDDAADEFAPIRVKTTRECQHKDGLGGRMMPEGATFSVQDHRSDERILRLKKLIDEKKRIGGFPFRRPSVDLLSPFMIRLDGGPNPAAVEHDRFIRRIPRRGRRLPNDSTQAEPMLPREAGESIIDFNTTRLDNTGKKPAKKLGKKLVSKLEEDATTLV